VRELKAPVLALLIVFGFVAFTWAFAWCVYLLPWPPTNL